MLKFYPLVDMDDEGTEKVPMFMTPNPLRTFQTNRFALEEGIPGYYRLIAKDGFHVDDYPSYHIHCPLCGKVMRMRRPHRDNHTLGEYVCVKCK